MGDSWVAARLRCRNARIDYGDDGQMVVGDIDLRDVLEVLVPHLVSHPSFIATAAAVMEPHLTMQLALRMMEHMTPDEVSEILGRFDDPS